ncbi:MAG: hypothetical protein DMG54_33150, partial [Acidobacteria bacterium]
FRPGGASPKCRIKFPASSVTGRGWVWASGRQLAVSQVSICFRTAASCPLAPYVSTSAGRSGGPQSPLPPPLPPPRPPAAMPPVA